MSGTTANFPPHDDPMDEPPPYTARADASQGETTVEFGPSRPFQQSPSHPARPPPQPQSLQSPLQSFLRPSPSRPSRGGRSLLQQFSDQLDQLASDFENRANTTSRRLNVPQQSTGNARLSHPGPGQSAPPISSIPSRSSTVRNPPPALPPRRRSSSTTSLPESSSEFARDFYAAGTGNGIFTEPENNRRSSTSNMARPPPNDRGPTTVPTPGRPLLRDGKLLVYPRGHLCEKCHNTGYKHFDPLRPCKKCWTKYGKSFSGPLAYSFFSSDTTSTTSNTQNINLQRPLPGTVQYSAGPTRQQLQVPDIPPRSVSFGGSPGGPFPGALPPGAVVYQPGDQRIGGDLCFSCNGKGTMNIFIDVINCPVCGGCGRTFIGRTF